MKQILHIFAKDVRRFWIEILVSLTITAAFTWLYPIQWLGFRFSAVHGASDFHTLKILTTLSGILVALVPVSWWLMASRLIQAERLVGEKQYWLTRPIRRGSLLGAKLLFLLLFLYLPFTIAQCVLLSIAGLSPLSSISGLLYNLLMITGIFVLPMLGFAAITSNFQRCFLTLLGAGLVIGLLCYFSSILESSKISSSWSDHIAFVLIFLGICVIVGIQYTSRRIWISRLLLLLLVLMLVVDVSAVLDQKLFPVLYPILPAEQAQPIVLDSIDAKEKKPTVSSIGDNDVNLSIPFRFSGVVNQHMVEFETLRFTLQSSDGELWHSLWQPATQQRFLPGSGTSFVNLSMRTEVYKRFKAHPVLLKVELAIQEATAESPRLAYINDSKVNVPGYGSCSSNLKYEIPFNPVHSLDCLTAFRHPYLTRILRRIDIHFEKIDEAVMPTSVFVMGWDGSMDKDPSDMGITSVWQSDPELTSADAISAQEEEVLNHATGSGYFFIQYLPTKRSRVELTVPNFKMPVFSREASNILLDSE